MAKRKRVIPSKDIEQEAAQLVKNEKLRWELATAFITDKVSFKMRPLIRILRKNYFGIFDTPIDPHTGLEKVWYPLTEINVEAVIKNIDLDTKDINFAATNPNGYGFTDLIRHAFREKLRAINFGQKLDEFERDLCIDGTAVWKTFEEVVNGVKEMIVRKVDLLNCYLDPTTPSIQQAYRFTERALMFPEEIKGMSGWINTEDIDRDVPEGLPRTDPMWMNRGTNVTSNIKEVDVYELWGKIPKKLITGERDDEGIEVEGHIVASGLDTPGRERCHLIELNTNRDREGNFVKPYEEAWFTKVPNRWYGRGVAEKLLTLQVYANVILNVRINRSRISQLGLFKVKKGAGVTPQMLSRLPSNGAIVLNNLDDLQELAMSEVGMSSYKDEDVINSISERLTNAFEVVTGERLPSSTPATNAAIQNTNAKSGFTLIKDSLGQFLERWVDNHALPITTDHLTVGDIIRIEGDDDSYAALVDRATDYLLADALDDHYAKGYIPSPEEVMRERVRVKEKLAGGMFIPLVKKILAEHLETRVFVTNEEMDVGVTINNLINMLNVAPEYRQAIVEQTFDLMGLPLPKSPQLGPQGPALNPALAGVIGGAVAGGMPSPQGIGALGGAPGPTIAANAGAGVR